MWGALAKNLCVDQGEGHSEGFEFGLLSGQACLVFEDCGAFLEVVVSPGVFGQEVGDEGRLRR